MLSLMQHSGRPLLWRYNSYRLVLILEDMRNLLIDRQSWRQYLGILFLIMLVLVGKPVRELFYLGLVLVLLGIAARLWASGHVKKNQVLATSGPYAYVRHPLYVGNHLIALGYCLASSLWWSLPAWVALALMFYPYAIRDEDHRLAQRFPAEWNEWSRSTRALIPRLSPYAAAGRGSWSFAQSWRENGEPMIAALLLLGLFVLLQKLP
ncbi:MAG: methyltransferase family protein [Burkholderiales bacterium]